MKPEQYEFIENTLRELSMFIDKCRVEEERENLKKLFNVVKKDNVAPTCNQQEDLQLNNEKEKGVLEKENTMLINVPGISITNNPRKDGRYQGYITDKFGRHYVYGKTQQEVTSKLNYYLKHGMPKRKQTFSSTVNGVPANFTAFANYYFENFRKKKVAELTYKIDVRRFNKHIEPHFKNTPLRKITPLQCQNLLESLTSQGKGKTADEIYALLSVIFKMAIKHSIITKNPLDVVYHEKHVRISGSALTREEEQKLKNALQGTEYLDFCMFMLYTGLRPNECQTAYIQGDFIISVNSKRKHKRTEYKKIPIIRVLKPFVKDGVPKIPRAENFRKVYKSILPNHVIYDMRTTFYSRCKEYGVSEHALAEYMGHSLGAIGNAYTDLSDEFLLNESKKLDFWQ